MTTQFILPPDVEYTCTICGECCREDWPVPIDQEALSRLSNIDWKANTEELPPSTREFLSSDGELDFSRESPRGPVLCKTDGGCLFLEGEHGCWKDKSPEPARSLHQFSGAILVRQERGQR